MAVYQSEAGEDATNACAAIGHSLDAKSLLKAYYLGDLTGQ